MRLRVTLLVGLLCACDGDERAAPPPITTSTAGAADTVPTTEEASDARWPALSRATADCPPPRLGEPDAMPIWYDECRLGSTGAFDPTSGRWLMLDVDLSEGGVEHLRLTRVGVTEETVLLDRGHEPAAVEELARQLASFTGPSPAQLVTGETHEEFSLNRYAPRVTLGGPLAGWELWVETTADLDHPEHVLWLLGEGDARLELARRAASPGPCDGGGYYCEETNQECDEAGLRAEDRLCVLPLGIDRVAVGPDRSLAVQGTVQVAGHGGYPPFHWVVALPESAIR